MKRGVDPKSRPHPTGPSPTDYTDILLQRFVTKIKVEPDTGCWIWTRSLTRQGYGRFSLPGGRTAGWGMAHRYAYMLLIGPIPDGFVTDHLCRNTACCNPWHIELVTQQENVQRGAASNRDSELCRRGIHKWVPENIIESPGDVPRCKPCRNGWDRMRQNPQGNLPPHLRTECPQGHPYDEENTQIRTTTGHRNCRQCHRDNERERYRRLHGLDE